jgi:hypothetical protein
MFPGLRQDYGATKVVVFNEPPAIDELLLALARLECEIDNLITVQNLAGCMDLNGGKPDGPE